MDSIVSLSKENCERNIKFDRKWIRGQFIWVIFNLSITCFDFQSLMIHPTTFLATAFGAIFVTSIWSTFFLFESWSELRSEKSKLRFLTELHDTQLASMERKQYLNSHHQYEQLIETLRKEKNEK